MKAEATAAGRELRILHHICSVYALIGLAVPTLGMATASRMHVLDSLWLIASSGLTAVAAVNTLRDPGTSDEGAGGVQPRIARSAGREGWRIQPVMDIVTVLMILRPGSTTGGTDSLATGRDRRPVGPARRAAPTDPSLGASPGAGARAGHTCKIGVELSTFDRPTTDRPGLEDG